jgi:carbon dioxide concentrating mechanism protein CcmO
VVGRAALSLNAGLRYITVLIKGDVAAVRAAIDAGKAKVDGARPPDAAHVIPSPSKGVLGLLPK